MKKIVLILSFCVSFLLFGTILYAAPILYYTGGDGVNSFTLNDTDEEGITRTAEAEFGILGDDLQIVLTNTQPDTKNPNQALAGIFFNYSGELGNALSVEITGGSTLLNDSGFPHGDDVSGEFGYYLNADELSLNASGNSYPQYFISSSSLDPEGDTGDNWEGLGPGNLVNPSMAWGNPPPNGPDFLLGNTVLHNDLNNFPIIENSVTILWDIIDLGTISDVYFVYGTDYATVPEPPTILLLGIGFIGFGVVGRQKFFKK